MPRQENIDLLQRASLRFKVRDLDGYLQMYSNSVIHHGFSSRIRPGVPGLRDHYTRLLNGFPDMRVEINDILADGEKLAHRFTFYGTHKGEFLGVPATGKLVTAAGIHIQLFEAGQCIEVWQVLDTFSFLSQMGAVPQLRERR
ncbi:MAG TPA: ester cyclase [Terriglobales bacterium]|jgi:predicted ester cyclase|nr:ester cyclase [Terriglobales bacterium]